MATDSQPARESQWVLIMGWILTLLPALMLLFSAVMKFYMVMEKPEEMVKGLTDLGYHENHLLGLGIVELGCTLIYLFPRTAVLGAILLTGYLGGAIASHVRLFEPFVFQILLGVFIWCGLYLREPRLRDLLPIR